MRVKLGVGMHLKEIARAMGGLYSCESNPLIEYVTTDSREAVRGDLYIPIKGAKYDGEAFVDGVRKSEIYSVSNKNHNAHILVKNTVDALLAFASYYNKNLPYILYRIGITGSVGKTTTKEFAKILLSEGYKVHANEGNFNNEIGLPMSLLSAPQDSQILIMEMGMNHLGEISRLSRCVCPDMAVITNVGTAHIGNLGSRENIAIAKLEIEHGMRGGPLYVPMDEELLGCAKSRTSLSLTDPSADFYLESNGKKVTIYNKGKIYAESDFEFCEEHLKKCLLFACAIAIDTGVSADLLCRGISSISENNIRQKVIVCNGYLFYTDFYNASAESIIASFDSVSKIQNATEKSLLLGDVLELGNMSEDIHYKIGQSIPVDLFSSIFLFGEFADTVAEGAVKNGFPAERIHKNYDLSCPDITAMQIRKYCQAGELILMKASRGVKLERVLEYFTERS